jgi:hypothetical protein
LEVSAFGSADQNKDYVQASVFLPRELQEKRLENVGGSLESSSKTRLDKVEVQAAGSSDYF